MTTEAARPEVLVIEDEVQIRRLLRLTLEESGFTMREAETGQAGLSEAAHRRPDAIILDLGLPDIEGLEVLRRLREWSPVPVLILSVFGQQESKIAALDAGADDYLTKPFGGGELVARIRVMLRHSKASDEPTSIRFGSIEVDLEKRLVTRNLVAIRLTAREYGLLRLFAVNKGKVLTHRHILSELWGPKARAQTHYLRIYMMRLRQKLEEDPDTPRYFQTESGVGYRLVE